MKLSVLKKVCSYIDDHVAEHVAKLRELIQQPSVSVEKYGTKECANLIRRSMLDLGFERTELFGENNPIVYGEFHSHKPRKTLLILTNYDSNPVEGDKWSVPPYEGRIVDKPSLGKCLVGRGANSKIKIAGVLNVIESFKEVSEDLPLDLEVVVDGEEEMFSPTMPYFVAKYENDLRKSDALYMPFPSQNSCGVARIQLGYKGIVYLELTCSGKNWGKGPADFEVHSMHRPIIDNPVWHLTHALGSMTSTDGNSVLIDGFEDRIEKPEGGFQELIDKLAKEFDPISYKNELGTSALMDEASDAQTVLRKLFCTSQINISGVYGGYVGLGPEAIIPNTASAKMDVRLIPNQKSGEVFQLIKNHLEKHGYVDIEIEKLAEIEWCHSSVNESIAQSLIKTYKSLGVTTQVWPSSLATISIYLFNSAPLKLPFATGCVGHGGHSHGADEYIVIDGKGKIHGIPGFEKCIASLLCEFTNS